MANLPGVIVKMLGPQTQARMTGHDLIILHTMVGYLVSTDRYFRIGNGEGYRGTESHYGVGGKWGPDLGGNLDGQAWLWQDRMYQADANLEDNPRALSIETADNAARPIEPWTPKQCETLARIIAHESKASSHSGCPATWTCHQSGIPIALIPDTLPGRRGVGYHRQGCDPWRVSGGRRWSPSYGKDCPTQARIDQIPGILARARELANGSDDMFEAADRAKLDKTFYAIDNIVLPALTTVATRVWKLSQDAGADQVDEDKIAAIILASLTPEKIVAAIPAVSAAEVADELAKRLAD